MSFGHLHIQAKSVDASAAFYTTYLDFEEVTRQEGMAILRDDTGLAFFIDPSPSGEPIPESVHIGFRLKSPDDVRAKYDLVREKIELEKELDEQDGFSIFTFRDPDQMLVEVFYSVL